MYDSYIGVDKTFKASVNLQYDLQNTEKISKYVFTTDLCDVIKQYVKIVLGYETARSTFLSGPYGKGKSYLLLMISYIFSSHKDKNIRKELLRKIRIIDNELADLIEEIEKNKLYLLTVVINNNVSDDIDQVFLQALDSSLKQFELTDLVPNSAFSNAIDLIQNWKENRSEGFDIIQCAKDVNVNLDAITLGLHNYDKKAFEDFKKLHYCITRGSTFNIMSNSDFVSIYDDVNRKLINHGYKGMFIVFDEFGVFLENQGNEFVKKLNKIQAFAEKCNESSNDMQMHFCCIAHKDILLYNKAKDKKDDFEKISGRFKQVRFERSIEENYQIICSAIKHKEGYNTFYEEQSKIYEDLIRRISEIGVINTKEQINNVFCNGFPFNPIAMYTLISVSEKVAQNERTLFTFLSDGGINGFKYYISNNDNGLLNVNHIYDYFDELIKNNEEVNYLYRNVQSLMNVCSVKEEHDVLKVIAIIKLINDTIKYPSTIEMIALSLAKDEIEIEKIVNELEHRNVLRKNIIDNSIDFAIVVDEELQNAIDRYKESIIRNKSLCSILNKVDVNKYFVSHRYNFENKITRYYQVQYHNSSDLKHMTSFNALFENINADGIIINVINDDNSSEYELEELIQNHGYSNIIIRLANQDISKSAKDKIYQLAAIDEFLLKNNKLDQSTVEMLDNLRNDLSVEINRYLLSLLKEASYISLFQIGEDLNDCIYTSLIETYHRSIILNNEQINKNTIQGVTVSARNKVIDDILRNHDSNFGPTSQEGTIKVSFDNSLNLDATHEVVSLIEQKLRGGNEKTSFENVISTLTKAPYGIRKGIVPMLLAKAISNITINDFDKSDTVVLYYKNQEIALNANNLEKAVNYPENYSYFYAVINDDKLTMIHDLANFLDIHSNNVDELVSGIVNRLKRLITNLPPIVIKSTKKENSLNLSNVALDFKDHFMKADNNPFNTLLNVLPALLNVSYKEVKQKLEITIDEYNKAIDSYYRDIAKEFKNMFSELDGTIKTVFEDWKKEYSYINNIIFEDNEKRMFNALSCIEYNDKDALNDMSKVLFNCYLDDWNDKKKDLFFTITENLINKVKKYEVDSDLNKNDFTETSNVMLSRLGDTLYSNLQSAMDEYGDSISNEEKALVLKKLMSDLLN